MEPHSPHDAPMQGLYYPYEEQGQPYNMNYPSGNYHPAPPHIPQPSPYSIPVFPHAGHQFPPYGSPPHGNLAVQTSTSPPPSPSHFYDPVSPSLSGSDTSADGLYHHSNSSNNSPSSSRGSSLVHRQRPTNRYNPTPSPTSSTSRRSVRGRSQDSDELDDDIASNANTTTMGLNYRDNLASSRKEATRRQRIEAEQRRRDELRDGYAKLKDVLPVSNLKSSKVSLLERATNHIISLERLNQELQARIDELEAEATRLRALNEKITIGSSGEGLTSAALLDIDSKPSHEVDQSSSSLHHVEPAPAALIQGLPQPSPAPSEASAY